MDVVYKLGCGSKSDDKELRYSLRSLSNFVDLEKVFVVGFKPRWLKEVIHIPAEDLHPANKDCNLINKLILACHHPEISVNFVNMSDDQVFLKEIDQKELFQPYYDNSLLISPTDRIKRWRRRLHHTVDCLKKNHKKTDCYETHIPTVLSKYIFPEIMQKYNYTDVPGMCGNTLFFNNQTVIEGREFDKNVAIKIEEAQTTVEAIERMCEEKTHLNYSESATNNQLFDFLQKKFPIQSKYEIF
jgi:hypothetical protein